MPFRVFSHILFHPDNASSHESLFHGSPDDMHANNDPFATSFVPDSRFRPTQSDTLCEWLLFDRFDAGDSP
jgi:hypothetical protein